MTGWADIDTHLQTLGVTIGPARLSQTTGGQHVATSNHYRGLARDYGDADSDCVAVVEAMRPYLDQLLELYYAPMGIWYPSNVGGHGDHVHVAVRPDGVLLTSPPVDPDPLRVNGRTVLQIGA